MKPESSLQRSQEPRFKQQNKGVNVGATVTIKGIGKVVPVLN
jgi:hypothetical protein